VDELISDIWLLSAPLALTVIYLKKVDLGGIFRPISLPGKIFLWAVILIQLVAALIQKIGKPHVLGASLLAWAGLVFLAFIWLRLFYLAFITKNPQ
jgi:hypothetical protein